LKAVEAVSAETGSKSIRFHQLDICDKSSIQRLRDSLMKNHGGLDVLVNNAGIAFKQASPAPFSEQVAVTNRTNFTGTLDVCRILFPILKPHARVVNVSSQAGLLSIIPSAELRSKLQSDDLKMPELVDIIEDFIKHAKAGDHSAHGYPSSAYGMSKVGVTAMTRILQRELDADQSKEDVVVTACCPGYVDTDMTSHKGYRTLDQGAETPIFLALLASGWAGAKGRFFYDKQEMSWIAKMTL
jgi:carbonyl reductase 1